MVEYKEVMIRRGWISNDKKTTHPTYNLNDVDIFDAKNIAYKKLEMTEEDYLNQLGQQGWILRTTCGFKTTSYFYTKYNFGRNLN